MDKDLLKRMAYVRSFKRPTTLPKVDNTMWELFGVCLGDGCLSSFVSGYNNQMRYTVIFTGNIKDDFWYYNNYIIPTLREKFNIKITAKYRPEYGSICFHIFNKSVFDYFKALGMPVGKKKFSIKINDEVLNSPPEVKAAVLRGLLDTDGHIFARKDEFYKYPYVKITSASPVFLLQLKDLIREFGLPAYIHDTDVLVRGGANLKTWMTTIGTSHPIHSKRYINWLINGKMPPKGS